MKCTCELRGIEFCLAKILKIMWKRMDERPKKDGEELIKNGDLIRRTVKSRGKKRI